MVDSDYTANLLGALATGVCDRVTGAALQATGLDASAAAALTTLAARPGRPIDHLRATLGLTHSGAARLAQRLRSAGLVGQVQGDDRRARCLALTRRGERLAEAARLRRLEVLGDLLADLDPQDRAALERLVTSLLGRLPQTQADAWSVCRYCDHAVCRGAACPVGSALD